MRRFAEITGLFVAAASLAAMAVAQEQSTPASPPTPPPAAAATQPAANPIVAAPGAASPGQTVSAPQHRRSRVISPEVAAQLSAAVPKYTPPPPKPAPVDDETDLRDIDKPKNGIVRLPKYVVHAPPPPVLNERTVNTQKGLADIAMRRYLTEADRALNGFTLPFFGASASDRALAMYAEDERLKNMADLTSDAGMVSASDKAAGAYVKREVDKTFVRPGDFDWKPMGR